jgi:RNA polymerase sigma factor (sigma-70 family)
MRTHRLSHVIQVVRAAAAPHEDAGPSDGQLLERYILSREEDTFAAIVHRHGPMVWGVCRRALTCPHDAEDAFQATFLVLVRKAANVVPREMVANWLYGVALQTARKARATNAKRRAREKQVTSMPEPAREEELLDDLRPLLDEELSRLPEQYRAVIVLCDLEGRTRKEAARILGVPEGTVATRLAAARVRLAKRLARSGLAPSAAAFAAALPPSVAANTVKAAALFAAGKTAAGGVSLQAVALAEGVLKTMVMSKLKMVAAVALAIVALGIGGAVLAQQSRDEKPKPPTAAAADKGEKPDEKVSSKAGREVVSAFEENLARVEEAFLGKKMRVTGKMHRVAGVGASRLPEKLKKADDQHYYLTFAAEQEYKGKAATEMPLMFVFPKSARKQLAELDRGQMVTIEGVCEGRKGDPGFYLGNYIVFTGCKIVKGK